MADVRGKVCLVTGAGRGLGIEIAKILGSAGAVVAACDIRNDLLDAMKTELGSKGIDVFTILADIGDEAGALSAVTRTIERFGTIDALINNAGQDVTLPVESLSVVDWDRVLKVNLRGPFLMSKFALPAMKNRGGSIVNIVSTAAKRTWANASAYHASKWGLLGFSHALHVEGRPNNIKVTALVSGGMKTPFLLERFPDIDASTLQDPANVARVVKFILEQPDETVIPEVMVIPMKETSWP